MGRWEEASKKASKALTLVHQQSHTYSLAVTIANVCNVYITRGDWLAVQRQADAGVLLCTEQGFASILEQFRMYRAYAMVRQGEKDAIAQLAEALAAYRATGTARTALNYPGFLSYLADACRAAAHLKEGLLDDIGEAFALIESTGERLFRRSFID